MGQYDNTLKNGNLIPMAHPTNERIQAMDDMFVDHVSDEDLEGLAGPSGLATNGCQCSLGSCTTQANTKMWCRS